MIHEDRKYVEVTYTCNKQTCRHQQTMQYFVNDPPLPVLCCVKCRSGFNTPLDDMLRSGIGMFPGKEKLVAA